MLLLLLLLLLLRLRLLRLLRLLLLGQWDLCRLPPAALPCASIPLLSPLESLHRRATQAQGDGRPLLRTAPRLRRGSSSALRQ